MATIRYKVPFGRVVKPLRKTKRWNKVKRVEKAEPKPVKSKDKQGSAAQLLALAHFVERGLNDGSIRYSDEAVAMLGIDRSWLSQILNLLDLGPEVQEVVFLVDNPVVEKRLREAVKRGLWTEQGDLNRID